MKGSGALAKILQPCACPTWTTSCYIVVENSLKVQDKIKIRLENDKFKYVGRECDLDRILVNQKVDTCHRVDKVNIPDRAPKTTAEQKQEN